MLDPLYAVCKSSGPAGAAVVSDVQHRSSRMVLVTFVLLESQITSCIIDASQEERVTLITILVFIVPDSTMMFIHLSVNIMMMDGYKHH
jgi:hypothetical protein